MLREGMDWAGTLSYKQLTAKWFHVIKFSNGRSNTSTSSGEPQGPLILMYQTEHWCMLALVSSAPAVVVALCLSDKELAPLPLKASRLALQVMIAASQPR